MHIKRNNPRELEALNKVKLFAVLQLIGFIMFMFVYVGFFFLLFGYGRQPASTCIGSTLRCLVAGSQLSRPFMIFGTGVIAYLGFVVIALFILRKGLMLFSLNDISFENPVKLATASIILLIVGIILWLVAIALLFAQAEFSVIAFGLLGTVSCGFGGLLFIIAEIMGLWQVGHKYQNSLIQIGAIFTVFVPLIGQIILYLGVGDIIRDVSKSK